MRNGCWILLVVTAAALIVAAQAASAPPAAAPTGKESSQVLHTSTLTRSRTVLRGPRRALRASGWQCCAWSQVDMYEYKAGTEDRQFDRLSKPQGADAKANIAPAQAPGQAENQARTGDRQLDRLLKPQGADAPGQAENAFEPAKEAKEKLNSPKYYWKIPSGGVCGDAGGAWKDAKCSGTEVCAQEQSSRLDQVWTETKSMEQYVQFVATASEQKFAEHGKAVDKGASKPSRGELNLGPGNADGKVVYKCQERS